MAINHSRMMISFGHGQLLCSRLSHPVHKFQFWLEWICPALGFGSHLPQWQLSYFYHELLWKCLQNSTLSNRFQPKIGNKVLISFVWVRETLLPWVEPQVVGRDGRHDFLSVGRCSTDSRCSACAPSGLLWETPPNVWNWQIVKWKCIHPWLVFSVCNQF